jgi:hypothetical protein
MRFPSPVSKQPSNFVSVAAWRCKQSGDMLTNLVILLALLVLGYLGGKYYLSQQEQANQQVDKAQSALATTEKQAAEPDSSTKTAEQALAAQQQALGLDGAEQLEMNKAAAGQQQQALDQQSATTEAVIETTTEQTIAESDLPALNKSDAVVRESLTGLSNSATWRTWLGTSQALSKFVQFSENLSRGKVPHKYFAFMAPTGKFSAVEVGEHAEGYLLDQGSYQRYNRIAHTIASLDAEQMVSIYHKFSPLLEQAFDEIGDSQQSFEQTLLQAIKRVRSTPQIQGEIELIRPSVMYKFADPKLERLSSLSKQLIRMGPRNTRLIQQKLTELEAAIVSTTAPDTPDSDSAAEQED